MIETPEPGSVADRAQRVLVANGRAPNLVRVLNDQEREALAALWQDGKFVDGAAETYLEAMVKFGERMEKEKATVAEADAVEGLAVVRDNAATIKDIEHKQPPAGRE